MFRPPQTLHPRAIYIMCFKYAFKPHELHEILFTNAVTPVVQELVCQKLLERYEPTRKHTLARMARWFLLGAS